MAPPTSSRGSRSRTGRAAGRASGPVSGRRAGRPTSRAGIRPTARAASHPLTGQPDDPPRSRFTGRAAVLVLVVAVLMISYASSMRAYLRQQHQLDALHSNIRHAKARIAALQREKERWQDPHYVEARARARFGWVLPGEIGFQVIGKNGHLLDQSVSDTLAAPASSPSAGPTPWWQSAWESVEAAGNPPVKKAPAAKPTPKMKIRPR